MVYITVACGPRNSHIMLRMLSRVNVCPQEVAKIILVGDFVILPRAHWWPVRRVFSGQVDDGYWRFQWPVLMIRTQWPGRWWLLTYRRWYWLFRLTGVVVRCMCSYGGWCQENGGLSV